uniref:Uncharacterized protein n=2 Tax=Heliothis virescens TaxID=7102 RepID=A0A2A4J182_HELVI
MVRVKLMRACKYLKYNPQLAGVSPCTRVAYAKFMRSKIKSEFTEREKKGRRLSEFSLEDEVFDAPKKKESCRKCSARSFRSRTPIPENSDDEGLNENEIEVEADVEDKGSEGGSEQTRPLKSSSQEPSEPSTPAFDPVDGSRLPPPSEFQSTDHVITIEPDTPTRTLYMTEEEDSNLQKPITPTPSVHSQSEQILSAASLESQYRQMTSEVPVVVTSEPPTVVVTSEVSEPEASPRRLSFTTPRSARVSPAASPSYGPGRGKSKATGKVVSGWL